MKPLNYIMLILTFIIMVIMISIVISPFIIDNYSMSEGKAKMFANLISSIIAIISMYVGSKLNSK